MYEFCSIFCRYFQNNEELRNPEGTSQRTLLINSHWTSQDSASKVQQNPVQITINIHIASHIITSTTQIFLSKYS